MLVDVWVQVATLVVFVLAGAGIVLLLTSDRGLFTEILYGLAVAVPAIGGLFLTLRLEPPRPSWRE